MALIHIDHVPETVKMNLPLNLVVPDPGQMKGTPVRERKVLYLLHGLSDDASAWQRFTTIEIFARKYGLVVVMPSAGRSFYTDQPNGQGYFTYLVEELPHYLEDVFGISPRRENTLVAGVSMGGYGAMKLALLHPERFFAAASFSGVLSLAILSLLPDDPRQAEFTHLFGDLTRLPGSEHDPATWLQRASRNPAALPRLFIACGRQEDVYPLSAQFATACQHLGIAVDYHEEDGRHEWSFWNAQIQRFLAQVLNPTL
ncbi:MAG TPA: alpha/beta hydrolase family protein [Anaerolineaceae bacterium]